MTYTNDIANACPVCGLRDYCHCTAAEQDMMTEIERLRLTDRERTAIEKLCGVVTEYASIDRDTGGCHWKDDMNAVVDAQALLERLK